jgi:DNA-binding NarL/FixJ family response regulator
VDIVFSDISMPGPVDGVALAAWIGANDIPTQVILTSGLASALAEARKACAHVKGFVSKPYDYEVVAARIRTMLSA